MSHTESPMNYGAPASISMAQAPIQAMSHHHHHHDHHHAKHHHHGHHQAAAPVTTHSAPTYAAPVNTTISASVAAAPAVLSATPTHAAPSMSHTESAMNYGAPASI